MRASFPARARRAAPESGARGGRRRRVVVGTPPAGGLAAGGGRAPPPPPSLPPPCRCFVRESLTRSRTPHRHTHTHTHTQNTKTTGTPPEAQRALADRVAADFDGVVAGYLPDDAWLVLLPPRAAARLSAELEAEGGGGGEEGRPATPAGRRHALLDFEPRHKVAPEWRPVLDALEAQRRRLGAQRWQDGGARGRQRQAADDAAASPARLLPDRARAWLRAARELARDLAGAVAGLLGGADDGRHAWACHPRLMDGHDELRPLKVLRHAMHDGASSAVPRDAPHHQRLVIAVHAAPCPAAAAARLAPAAAAADGAAAAAVPHDPAAAAAADWAAPLAALARDPRGCGPPRVLPLQAAGAHANAPALSPAAPKWEFSVAACPQDLAAVLAWLSRHPAVHYVHPRGRAELQSNAIATAIMQGGDMAPLLASPPPIAGAAAAAGTSSAAAATGEHPAWAAGLTGAGQVVGIGDSGIDVASCYFNDPAVPFVPSALPVDPATRSRVFASAAHRKIAFYLGAGGDALDNVGHGTHTSGSLAGSRADGKVDAATGAAPGARIAFMDLTSDASGDVNAPDDLGDGYFSRTYAQGARVHSDSWGSNLVFYDGAAASLDRWTHEHDDFVSVIAAGNYGREQRFNSTVTSPATSKNCVAVGATLNLQPGPGEPPRVPVLRAEFSIRHAASSQAQRVAYYLTQASFGADAAQALGGGKALPVLRAEPRDACSAATKAVAPAGGAPPPADYVLLVDRGGCNFFDKAKNAQAAGAKGVIVVNTLPEGYFTIEAPEDALAATPIAVPVLGGPLGVGQVLRAALGEPGTLLDVTVSPAPAEGFQALPSYENIAQYSSFGPTRPDGRVKPDVVAPGGLVSAAGGPRLLAALSRDGGGGGGGQCATTYEQGTSMATPVVAGSVALIRQYFTDAYYPAGSKGAGAPHPNPSGYLLKAVLLGGASALQGLSEARLPLEPAPSFRQGFGRVNLTRALALGGGGGGSRIQVVDRAELAQGEAHTYCVSAGGGGGGGGALSVTLAWYDPPALPSAGRPLVNDLDLTARVAAFGGALARGNGAQPGPDTVNTVERVSLDGLPAGPVAITVSASRVFPAGSRQAYALVVQGRFTGVLASAKNPDPAGKSAPADGGAAACMQLQPPPAPPAEPAAPAAPAGSQAPAPAGEKQLASDGAPASKAPPAAAAASIEAAVAAEGKAAAAKPAAQESAATPAPAEPPQPAATRTRRRRRSGGGADGQEQGYTTATATAAVTASSEEGAAAAAAAEPAAPAGPPASDADVLNGIMGSGR